jgi:hypothetical protein
VPITLKTITLFHCVCIRCKHEWDSPTKPKRCAGCKYRTWNGEDHRFADPYDGVPQTSQIATGTDAPQLPNYLPLLGTLTAAREVVSKVVETGPCKHKQFHCVCAATEVLADLDQRIEQLNAMRPLRKTYLTRKRRAKAAEAVSQ